MLRGQRDRLEQLDQLSDLDLVKKWAWTSAIVGAVAAFAGMPLLLNIGVAFLPLLLMQFLWAATKVGMAMVFVMFAVAAYLTFWKQELT